MDFDKITTPVFLKYFLVGGALALGWLLIFIFSGAIWSLTHTNTLSISDHFYNGFVFATQMNFLSWFMGFSVGLSLLYYWTKNYKINSIIIGFVVLHLCIVGVIWWVGALDYRADPLPERIIDRIINLNDIIERPN